MTKRMIIMLGAVVVLIAALALGKFLQIKQLMASMPKPGAQTVTAQAVASQDWQPQLSSVGTLNPVRGVDVTTEIAGLVRSVNFKSGQDVKIGTVLVQLNADSDIAQLHALQAAAELAATVLARDKQLLAIKGVSQAQVDNDAADLKSKRAVVEEQVAVVDKKTIRAPFSGRLGITTVNPGQFLNAGDKIVTLQTINPIFVDFNLPQKQLAGLALGQTAHLNNDAFPGVDFPGKVTAINPKVDAATRSVQVEATVANDQLRLMPGMFANVNVDAGSKLHYLTLPQTAVTYNPYGATVFLLNQSEKAEDHGALVAQQVFVTTGPTRGDQVAILTGLKEGQTVVTSGQLKLKNGTPVIVDNSVQPSDNPAPTPQEH